MILEAVDRASRTLQTVRGAWFGLVAAGKAASAAAPVKAMDQLRGATTANLAPMGKLRAATVALGEAHRAAGVEASASAKALTLSQEAARAGIDPVQRLGGATQTSFDHMRRATVTLDAYRGSVEAAGRAAAHAAPSLAADHPPPPYRRKLPPEPFVPPAPPKYLPQPTPKLPARDEAGRFLPGGGAPAAPPPPASAHDRRIKALDKAKTARDSAQSQLISGLALSASVAAPVAKAVGAWNAYEDKLNDVGMKSELTGVHLAALGERVKSQARALNMSAVELLGGMDKLMEGGLSAEKAEGALPALAKAAIATKTPISDLSQLTVAMINNGKVAPQEIGRAMSVLAQTGKEGNAELNRMVPYLPRLTSQFSTMGRTGVPAVADIGAAFQVVNGVVNNMEGSAAGIRDVLTKINSPKATKAFKEAGVDINKVMKEAVAAGRPLDAILETLQKFAGSDLTKINDIFGDVQAQQAARALLQNLKEFERIRAKGMSAEGVIDQDFATRMGLGVEKTRALQVAMAELWTTLGQALAPAFARRVEQLTALIWQVQAWIKANPELAATLAQVATALAGVLVVSAALALAFATLRVGLLAPLIWLGRLGGLAGGAAGGVGLLGRAASALALPFRMAWWAVSGFFSGLTGALRAGIAAVGGWGAAGRLVLGRLAMMFSFLLSPIQLVIRAVLALGAALMATPVGWIAAAVAALAAAAYLIYANWDKLGPWFWRLWGSISEAFASGWAKLSSWFSSLGGRIGAALSSAWASVTQWFSSLSWPSFSWPELPSLGDVFAAVRAALASGWTAVTGWFSSLGWPSFEWPAIPSPGDVFAGVRAMLESGWNGATQWLATVQWPTLPDPVAAIRAALDPALRWIEEWGGKLASAVSGAFDKVSSLIGNLGTAFGAALDPVVNGLSRVSSFVFGPSVGDVKATADQAAAAKAAIDALPPAASQTVAAVSGIFAGANFTSQGVAMMTTLASGIRAGTSSAVAAAAAAVQQIRDHLPHSPAKVGPLSDLDKVQFGQTLAGAITAGAPRAVAAARLLAAGVAATLPVAPPQALAIAAPQVAPTSLSAPTSPRIAQAGFVEPASPSFARAEAAPGRAGGGEAGVRGGSAAPVNLTFAPVIHGADAGDVMRQLEAKKYELVEIVRAEMDRRERARH